MDSNETLDEYLNRIIKENNINTFSMNFDIQSYHTPHFESTIAVLDALSTTEIKFILCQHSAAEYYRRHETRSYTDIIIEPSPVNLYKMCQIFNIKYKKLKWSQDNITSTRCINIITKDKTQLRIFLNIAWLYYNDIPYNTDPTTKLKIQTLQSTINTLKYTIHSERETRAGLALYKQHKNKLTQQELNTIQHYIR